MHELLVRNPARMAADEGQQLWDELAALTVSEPGLVTWDDATVAAGADGRLTRDETGRTVRYARAADHVAVEVALVSALQRGGRRLTPFEVVGQTTATWDGVTCALARPPAGPGLHTLRLDNTSGAPVDATIVGLEPPHAWSELVAFIDGVDLKRPETAEAPMWIHQLASIGDMSADPLAAAGTFVEFAPGPGGLVCLTGSWPDVTFVPGVPFDVPMAPP
jgi:hypothetical protein